MRAKMGWGGGGDIYDPLAKSGEISLMATNSQEVRLKSLLREGEEATQRLPLLLPRTLAGQPAPEPPAGCFAAGARR